MRSVISVLSVGVLCVLLLFGFAHAAILDCGAAHCVYVPLVANQATVAPTPRPPSFNDCQADPAASTAPNNPVEIVTVLKAGNPEIVRLRNVSDHGINLVGWRMCSIKGNQEHTGISGILAPGQTRDFAYTGVGNIWNNNEQDDGALYNPQGQLVSYWFDR